MLLAENTNFSPGNYISTVGIGEKSILKYVQFQAEEETGQAQLEF